MNKLKFLLVFNLIFFFSYANPKVNQPKINIGKEITFDKSELAKKWLIKSIESFFREELGEMSLITTKSYNEYKSDAMNIDMGTDGSLTLEQFNKKWKKKYDLKNVGFDGFLISAQDWGKVTVTKCQLLSTKDKVYVFQVIIKDVTYKGTYKRDIKVIESGKSFLIDDVKEY
ncbi:MAG: hypothetical protein ABI441_00145 [Flavobacterium sp.]